MGSLITGGGILSGGGFGSDLLIVNGLWPGHGATVLSQVNAAGFPSGTLAWVESVGRYFRLALSSALATSGGGDTQVVNALLPAGAQWLSVQAENRAWQLQTTWSVDESNITGLASDENSGVSDGAPLLTMGELLRRLGPAFRVSTVVTVRWLSNAITLFCDLSFIYTDDTTALAAYVVFQGIPTVVQSGTLTGGTAGGAGNNAPIVEDTAIASTWTAAGGISTSTGGRLIRKTSGNVRAWISKELGSKQARASWGSNCPETVGASAFSPGAASLANGDAYEVLSLPSFPGIKSQSPSLYATRFLLVHMTGGSLTQIRTNGSLSVWCSGGGLVSAYGEAAGITLNCCCFMGGITATGTVFSRFGLFGGSTQVASFNADWNGFVNTIQGGSFSAAHGSNINLSGTLHFYDSATGLTVTSLSKICLQAIHGSGNTGPIVDVVEAGCKAISRDAYAGLDATTSAAKPLRMLGTTYDYADAIAGTAQSQVKDAGFFG